MQAPIKETVLPLEISYYEPWSFRWPTIQTIVNVSLLKHRTILLPDANISVTSFVSRFPSDDFSKLRYRARGFFKVSLFDRLVLNLFWGKTLFHRPRKNLWDAGLHFLEFTPRENTFGTALKWKCSPAEHLHILREFLPHTRNKCGTGDRRELPEILMPYQPEWKRETRRSIAKRSRGAFLITIFFGEESIRLKPLPASFETSMAWKF